MIYLYESDRLLFQGDSITHGGRGENQWDKNHVLGHGYQTLLAGRLLYDNRAHMPEIYNRGVSGDGTAKLAARWDADTLALRPTVLSLLIGVNDCYRPGDHKVRDYAAQLEALLARTRAALPEIKLILCEPFAFPAPGQSDADAAPALESMAACAKEAKAAAERFGAVYVPFRSALAPFVDTGPPGSVIWDGVHPTALGHEIMARQWYETVDKSGLLRERG